MTMQEKANLISALSTLRVVCDTHRHCEECPLGTDKGECMLESRPPADYEINNTIEKWRALK